MSSLVSRRLLATSVQWNSRAASSAAQAKSEPLNKVDYKSDSNIVTLGLKVKSGCRHENYDNEGISHAMRLVGGLATKNFTSFGKTRELQQRGSTLQVHQGREQTLYAIQIEKAMIEEVAEILLETVGKPSFKHWEIHDLLTQAIRVDLNNRSPTLIATEALHKAAFRTGLGNGLFCPERNVGNFNTVAIQEFYDNTHTAARCQVVSGGVPELSLTRIANNAAFKSSGKGIADIASKFHSGDVRIDGNGDNAYVALAAESGDGIAAGVVQCILGVGAPTKRGNGGGKLQKAVKAAVGDVPHSVNGLNFQYSDSGLLGAVLAVDASSAGKAVDAIVKEMRTLKIDDKDVAAGKKRYIIQQAETCNNPLNIDNVMTVEEMASAVNSVTTAQVQAAAKKLAGKLAIGATGNLAHVPYVDSL